ncbi:MAG: hypothetical protein K0Q59_4586, partial [Paenibacillus sp.]|nr:hypothetical protein [Paenibacillus sp.]
MTENVVNCCVFNFDTEWVGMHMLSAKAKEAAAWLGRNKWSLDIALLLPFVYLSLKIRLQYYYFLASPGQSFPTSDDSVWYLKYAHALLADKQIGTHMNDLMYMGYNLTLAFWLGLLDDPVNVLFIQSLLAGLSVILVYLIASMLFNRLTAVIASYLFCYHTWSVTLWSVYILADSFFTSLLLLVVYLLLKWRQSGGKVYRYAFIASAIYLALFKPTGLLVVTFIGLYVLINTHWADIKQFFRKYGLPLAIIVVVAVVAVILALATGKLSTLIASMQLNIKMVLYNVYAKGWIYDKPSPFDHPFKPDYNINVMGSLTLSFIVNNWDHVFVLYAKRAIAFIGNWVWQKPTDLTTLAGIKQFAEYMLPTVLFFIGIAGAFAAKIFRKASI